MWRAWPACAEDLGKPCTDYGRVHRRAGRVSRATSAPVRTEAEAYVACRCTRAARSAHATRRTVLALHTLAEYGWADERERAVAADRIAGTSLSWGKGNCSLLPTAFPVPCRVVTLSL